jgi:hypothetical protein
MNLSRILEKKPRRGHPTEAKKFLQIEEKTVLISALYNSEKQVESKVYVIKKRENSSEELS